MANLTRLRGVDLTALRLHYCTQLTDLSPLAESETLTLPPNAKDIKFLRAFPKLERIGFTENPKIAAGRISVTVHLLSPAQRPIQTTGDLGRFWREGYPAVKAQLRGRYPRHEWR